MLPAPILGASEPRPGTPTWSAALSVAAAAAVLTADRNGAPSVEAQPLLGLQSLAAFSATADGNPAFGAQPSFSPPAVLPALAPLVGGAADEKAGKGVGGGGKGNGGKDPALASAQHMPENRSSGVLGSQAALAAATATIFPADARAYGDVRVLLDQVLPALLAGPCIGVDILVVDGHKNGNNPDGPTITDHSMLKALAAVVGGNLRIYSPREQPYSGCAVVAAAARVMAWRSKSNLAAASDLELSSSLDSAFDLANVAALHAEENKEQPGGRPRANLVLTRK